MPNIIKSNYVLITGDKVKVIDSNLRDDDFAPMEMDQAVSLQEDADESAEDLEKLEAAFQMNHTLNSSESLHKMQSQAETIVENALKEAEVIKMEAIQAASVEISQCKEETRKAGYEEGYQEGLKEAEVKLAQIDERKREQEEEYQLRVADLQANVSNILTQLILKITGVVVKQQSIINYLVQEAIKGQSSCNEYLIQVSKEDYPVVYEQMDVFKGLIKRTANLTVEENPELAKNQCMIITDKNIIDCGLETKLSNLAEALRLLSLN